MAGQFPGDAPRADQRVIGRTTELAALDAFVASVDQGPAMLVLEGEPGLGKSKLWREGLRAASAQSYRILECCPVEVEAQMAFTALSDLLADLPASALDVLPLPQRRALQVALLHAEPEAGEMFPRAVSLGFLGVLGALARSAPVIVGIDDAHWLDQASQGVLAFAVRRLRGERVGVLVTRRPDARAAFPSTSADLALSTTWVRLGPLDTADVEHLLRSQLGNRLGRGSLARIERSAAGNPLFALQLGRALLDGGLVDDADHGLLIPTTLQQVVAAQLHHLAPASLDVVHTAAALARPTTRLIEDVHGTISARDGLAAACAAGVLTVDGDRVGFTHPLLATAAYSRMPQPERQRLHRHLADIVEDVEERGRHLAAAADHPDAAVAAALDAAALRARARYAPDSAADLWNAAARLTPAADATAAWARRLHAADCMFEAGEVTRARDVLEDLVALASSGPARARALARLGWVVAHIDGYAAGAATFQRALDEGGDDLAVTVDIEGGLAFCLHSYVGLAAAEPHARRSLDLAVRSGDVALAEHAQTLVEFLDSLTGRGLAVDAVGRVAGRAGSPGPEVLVRPGWMHGLLLVFDDHLPAALERFDSLQREATERGDEHALPFILFHLARTELLSGDWEKAALDAKLCSETARSSGQASERPYSCDIEALVAAHLGLVEPARTLIAEGLDLSKRYGVLPAELELLATRGFLELSMGRHDDADRTLAAVAAAAAESGLLEPALFRYHGDAIEAKIALGRLEEAATLLDQAEHLAAFLVRPSLSLIAGRGRGLFLAARGHPEDAVEALGAALAEDRAGQPFERARTLLALGSVHRRNRQKRAAREALEAARHAFVALGAALWEEKAAAELARVGGRAATDGLTPTELQIARRIAAGGTYREVAAELFISPKTVQWNLSKVYRKLDIRSRAELPGRLDAG